MLGGLLKDARMRQNMTIEDLERETSIRKAYISALEEENWDILPSPVYVKGFIRNLSNFLHIDSIPLIEEYISIINGNPSAPKVEDNSAAQTDLRNNNNSNANNDKVLSEMSLKEKHDKKKSGGAFLIVALIVALIGAGAFYFINKDASSSQETPSVAANNEKEKTVTETAKPKPTKVTEKVPIANNSQPEATPPAPQQAQTPAIQPAQPANGVEVSAKFNGNCWIKVVVDGNVVFEDIAEDGSNLSWKGNDSISVVAGNAGAMEITHNGKDLGALGAYGQVAEKVFTK